MILVRCRAELFIVRSSTGFDADTELRFGCADPRVRRVPTRLAEVNASGLLPEKPRPATITAIRELSVGLNHLLQVYPVGVIECMVSVADCGAGSRASGSAIIADTATFGASPPAGDFSRHASAGDLHLVAQRVGGRVELNIAIIADVLAHEI